MKQKLFLYARLMRLHRPVGIWLLLWPCWWSMLLVSYAMHRTPSLLLMILFFIGAIAMRSAGCIVNDMADRKFDKQVERTKDRPLASGELSIKEAWGLLALLCSTGLCISIILGTTILALSCAWIPLITAYPFMKRITWWPQVFLGITFNAGAMFGWVSVVSDGQWQPSAIAAPVPLILYIGAIFWTLGYDTIYAMQDRKDDVLIGVKSSALRVGSYLIPFCIICYSLFIISLLTIGHILGLPIYYYLGISCAALLLIRQIYLLKVPDPTPYSSIFSNNTLVGFVITLSCIVVFYA
jgi:4-hydroxybenzoate polyprenyltransferase